MGSCGFFSDGNGSLPTCDGREGKHTILGFEEEEHGKGKGHPLAST